jgi:hypothetical protein
MPLDAWNKFEASVVAQQKEALEKAKEAEKKELQPA